jgi:hypothetical protein
VLVVASALWACQHPDRRRAAGVVVRRIVDNLSGVLDPHTAREPPVTATPRYAAHLGTRTGSEVDEYARPGRPVHLTISELGGGTEITVIPLGVDWPGVEVDMLREVAAQILAEEGYELVGPWVGGYEGTTVAIVPLA